MKNFKALTLATLTAIATIAAPAAEARNVDQAHIRLAQAIRSTGILLIVNHSQCANNDYFGWYDSYQKEMVVCQENGQAGKDEVNWTEEDLDTLRHEAQHLIQDCVDGELNGALGAVYKNPMKVGYNQLGEDGVNGVWEAYSAWPDHHKVMEVEAFAVAAMNKPGEQAADIATYCL